MNNPAKANQLIELSGLQMKRLEPLADQEAVKAAIADASHPFWAKYAEAITALVVEAKSAASSLLRKLKDIAVEAVGQKKTADCFTDRAVYYYRGSDFDGWLPKVQAAQPAGSFSVHKFLKDQILKQMAEEILGTTGNIAKLSSLIIEHGLTTTLPAIETLIKRQEGGEDVGLRTDGYVNFFFVEDADGNVSVVCAYRGGGRWYVDLDRLDGDSVWGAGCRVFVRNS